MSIDNAAREKAMSKIRKLLAMGNHGSSNMQEAETALRQAQILMRQYQIDSIDEIKVELGSGENFKAVHLSPYAYPAVDIPSTVTRWVNLVSLGIARMAQVRVSISRDQKLGAGVVFSGYNLDVDFAVWLYKYVLQTVHQLSINHGGTRAARNSFRLAAASVVQRRMLAIVAQNKENDEQAAASSKNAGEEDDQQAAASSKNALVLVSMKQQALAERFGKEPDTVSSASKFSDLNAARAGRAAGEKMNIPTNRPLQNQAAAKAITRSEAL